MAQTAQSLFDAYCALPRPADRLAHAIAAPRLLWSRTVKALLDAGVPASKHDLLAELDQLRRQLLMRPEGYPIGHGPIERMMAGGATPNEVVEACRGADLQALLAPPYLRALAEHAADRARTPRWETGAWLSRFAAEAALAWEPGAPIEHDIGEALLAHLEMALYALGHQRDETVFGQSLSAAMALLKRAEQDDDFEVLGKLCQSIGSLWSDVWTVPGAPSDDSPVPIEAWLARPAVAHGLYEILGPTEPMPAPDECLRTAVGWYRRALPYRSGAARGLSYKAIVQTEAFRAMALHQPVDDAGLQTMAALAAELVAKHEHGQVHLQVLASIARARHWPPPPPTDALSLADLAWMSDVTAAYEPGPDDGPEVERRRAGHAEALRDLHRAVRHGLPWALYLRNFKHANEIRLLGEPIVRESDDGTHIVVPQVSYSLVDHKILQLCPEGVVTVCDPGLTDAHRTTPIPMLSLRNERWLPAVRHLATHAARIVMLLDELTPGVADELALLQALGVARRTLLVCGHAYRTGEAALPPAIVAAFPHVVDWVDFGFDENHHDMRYKAHRVIQHHLLRYVRDNAQPTVRAWLESPG